MDNAVIIDLVIAVILLAGLAIGAHRGLFKSLMGLVVVVASLFGAVYLSNLLAPPLTERLYPLVEDAVIERFVPLDAAESPAGAGGAEELLGLLGSLGVPEDTVRGYLDRAQGAAGGVRAAAAEAYRSAIAEAVRLLLGEAVRAILLFVLFAVLLLVLRLLTRALDRVLDLPVLSTVNGVGGAALGLAEAALLVFLAVWVTRRLGVAVLTGHEEDTYLLPFFLNHSPIGLIVSLFR